MLLRVHTTPRFALRRLRRRRHVMRKMVAAFMRAAQAMRYARGAAVREVLT